MIVRLDLHQNVVCARLALVAASAAGALGGSGLRNKALDFHTLHHRSVVGIGHQHVLRIRLMCVANHAKHAHRLRRAIDAELGIENLVPAMLAIGLREHHQFDVRRVAL